MSTTESFLGHRPKKVLIALPPAMLDLVDHMALEEHRTRSDLIREALRRYHTEFKKNQNPATLLNQFKESILNPQPAV